MPARHLAALALFAASSLPLAARAQHASVTKPFATCAPHGPGSSDAGTTSLQEISAAIESAPAIAAADDTTMGCEERHPGHEKLAAARTVDAPGQVERQSDCSLAALKSAMGWLASQHHTANPSLYGRKNELDAIFPSAIRGGYAGVGGISSLANIAKFAREQYKLDVEFDQNGLLSARPTVGALKAAVAAGYPVIVSICVDHEGCPVTPDEDHPHPIGHAAVIEGFVKDAEGREYVIVKHGWRDKDFLWRVDDFKKSWDSRENQMVVLKPSVESQHVATVEELMLNRP